MSQGTGYVAQSLPQVIIVGGGFAGLAAAKALRKAPVQVLLIDKVNHSLFQPLLYQVAGSMLDGGDIAFPIRAEFRNQKNIIVAMAELTLKWVYAYLTTKRGARLIEEPIKEERHTAEK